MDSSTKDYNTSRKKLALPEYGRNVHNMVDLVMQIEDRDIRNQAAQALIDVMGNLNPWLRDIPDFKHKLWDHLAIMAEFKLDIDYPYNPPLPEILLEKPHKVPYSQRDIRYKHYGYTMELMIRKAMEFEDGKEKDILSISHFSPIPMMKLTYGHSKRLFLHSSKPSNPMWWSPN